MPVSFVLRLVPSDLAESKIVGQVREVETGETAQLRNAEDLLSFLFVHSGDRDNGGQAHDQRRGDQLTNADLPTWPEASPGTSAEQASACLAWFCMGMALATTGRLDEALERLELPVEVRVWAEAYGRYLLSGEDGVDRCGIKDGFLARANAERPFKLSVTEAMVARLVADGRSNKQIAAELVVSPKTVEYHLSNIYRRLGFSSRVKLAQLVGLAA